MEVSSRTSDRGQSQSSDGETGAAHVNSIIDLLLTVGYIDGVFHDRERRYVQRYIAALLIGIEQSAPAAEAAAVRDAWQGHFNQLYQHLDAELARLADDATELDGPSHVREPLHERAVSLFKNLPSQDRSTVIELVHALIHADGEITPPESALYQELAKHAALPDASPSANTAQMRQVVAPPDAKTVRTSLLVGAPTHKELVALSHPVLDPLEQTLSPHPVERKSQVEWDYQLLHKAINVWHQQRVAGSGRLTGMTMPDQIPVGATFLDQYVYMLRPDHPVELVVLGDLHGCYSCLKAALLQSNFIQRVWAHQWDPERYPDVKLVFLGDYIDRGLFSFDGVLRTVLQLFVSMPDHVYVLRGNHEFFKRVDNQVFACVHPAEALASITPHVPLGMLDGYRVLFEHMPTSLVCDQTLFVHAGIPRDDTFAERYRDLSSLNDPELRFQMMWSDPAVTDHIPVDMQRKNPRFSFGRNQFKAFMQAAGLNTMVRGHEKIESGFQLFYDLGEHVLLNLFSAGGHDNRDLPVTSSYRKVTPMALTMQFGSGTPIATPWPLQYQPFNYPPHNGLYRPHPLLEFRYA
jgi:uncharacterized tellurite resistance protein B-like protein